MTNISNKIVSMKFDNAAFQKGVKETTKSLVGLKKDLKFDGAGKGLDEMSNKVKGFNFANMAEGLSNISSKFSVMGAVGFAVVQKLTQGFMSLASKGIRAVLAPLLEGGNKRALTLEQAKFQFEGLGMDIKKTMASALEAVKGTAYGLDAAAKAASMFGASGMTAGDDMTSALRAISGVAAMTGSSYEDISQVFTTVAGNGRLMGTELLRLSTRGINAAATLGKSMGKSESEVRKMVSEGKISFKEFYTAMDDAFGAHAKDANKTFAGALANMKAALSRLGAAFATPRHEAFRKILLAITDVIDDLGDALEPVIKAFTKMSVVGSDAMVKLLKKVDLSKLTEVMYPAIGALHHFGVAIGILLKVIGSAFAEIFPAPSIKSLTAMVEGIRDFAQSLKMGGETADKLKRTFAGLFAILGIGWEIVKGVAGVILDMFGAAQKGSGGILSFTASIGDFLVGLHKAIKEGGVLSAFFKGIGAILSIPIRILGVLGGLLGDLFGGFDKKGADGTATAMERLSAVMHPLKGLGKSIKKIFGGMKPMFDALGKILKPFIDGVSKALGGFGDALADSVKTGDFSAVLGIIQTGLLGGLMLLLRDFFAKGLGLDFRQGLIGSLRYTFTNLTGSLRVFQANVKAKTLMTIAVALAILTVSIVALSMIDPEKLAAALTAITGGFGMLLGSFALINEMSVGMFKLPMVAAGLILLAGAILVLSVAMKIMSTMSWNEIAKGLVGLAGALVIMLGAAKVLGAGSKGMMRAGLAMIPLAIGILILSTAVKSFGSMDWNEIGKGLTSMAGALLVVAAAMHLMPKGMVAIGVGMVAVGAGLVIIAKAMKTFGNMSWGEMVKGMVGMAGALVIIAGAMAIMPPNMLLTAASLVVVGTALNIIAKAMSSFGDMSWGEIAKSLVVLAGSLVILAAGLYAMSGTLAGAAALVVASAALMMLAPALVMLGAMSWMSIIKGMVTLAATFVILGLAGLVLAPITPIILALSAAIFLFGAGIALAGVGVLAFSVALAALTATFGVAGVAMIAMLKAIIDLIPNVFVALAKGLLGFVQVLADGAPKMIDAFAKILDSLLDAVIKITPKIGKALEVLIDTGLNVIIKLTPKFVTAGFNLLMAMLHGLDKNIYRIVNTVSDIIAKFLRALGDNSQKIIDAGFDMIIDFINGTANAINARSGDLRQAGKNLANAIINGMTFGLWNRMGDVKDAAMGVARTALNTALNFLGVRSPSKEFIKIGKFVDEGFALGMDKHAGKVSSSAEGIGKAALNTVKNSIGQMSDAMESNMDYSPSIKPVLDLSDIQKGSGKIGSLLDKSAIDVSGNYSSASGIAGSQRRLRTDALSEAMAKEPVSSGTNISYVQNNNSPKALSEIEIYRQTKNQLSTLKGSVSQNA